ncbi:methyl-accepting chemotaxis protein [Spirochaeta dissipatitropha]
MTITRKMTIVLIAILSVFVGSIGLMLAANNRGRQLMDLQTAANQIAPSMNGLRAATLQLLVSSNDFALAVSEYETALQMVNEHFTQLNQHPALSLMPEDTMQLVDRSTRVWAVLVEDYERLSRLSDSILEQAGELNLSMPGVLRMREYLTNMARNNPRIEEARSFLLLDAAFLDTRITSASDAGSNLINTNLSELGQQIERRSEEQMARNMNIALVISVLAVILSLLFMSLLARNLTRNVLTIESIMKKVAARDMSARAEINSKDEFGQLGRHVNNIVESLSEFLRAVRGATRNVDQLKDIISAGSEESASALNEITENISSIRSQFEILNAHVYNSTAAIQEIVSNVDGLNDNIREQSSAVAQSSASIEQMTASIRSVNDLSNERRKGAESLATVVRDGGEKIASTNEAIKLISKEIVDVQEVITIINEISSQTNLLSMNAAIESAHAGDAGKGFAVVAEEIRKLAESTTENSTQISASLQSITGKIEGALQFSNEGYTAIETIIEEVTHFAAAMLEISHSMDELASGSGEILSATSSVTNITENIRQSAEQMRDRSQAVLESMNSTSDITTEVVNGIVEIDTGAREILQSVMDISNQANKSREGMVTLNELLESFKTD